MEAKHTPGPWEWNKYGADDATVSKMRKVGIKPTLSLTNEGSTVVNSVNGPIAFACLRRDDVNRKDEWETEDQERDANANLIAVAPELLVACEAVLALEVPKQLVLPFELIEQLRAVVAKATS